MSPSTTWREEDGKVGIEYMHNQNRGYTYQYINELHVLPPIPEGNVAVSCLLFSVAADANCADL